ncbi:MAG: hypothetical protein JWR15_3180 [Prosthecobacter sp.]|nr:hypothetical protein [Prosthecobacter sp.]
MSASHQGSNLSASTDNARSNRCQENGRLAHSSPATSRIGRLRSQSVLATEWGGASRHVTASSCPCLAAPGSPRGVFGARDFSPQQVACAQRVESHAGERKHAGAWGVDRLRAKLGAPDAAGCCGLKSRAPQSFRRSSPSTASSPDARFAPSPTACRKPSEGSAPTAFGPASFEFTRLAFSTVGPFEPFRPP